MSGRVFVDTNVLVYARDATVPEKQVRAANWMEHLWRSGYGRLSYQVLQEYYVTVTSRLRPGLSPSIARDDVRDLTRWNPVSLDLPVVEAAWTLQDRHGVAWWDALIIAAAQHSGCTMLLTEDLQHGQRFGALEVVSPFEVLPPDS